MSDYQFVMDSFKAAILGGSSSSFLSGGGTMMPNISNTVGSYLPTGMSTNPSGPSTSSGISNTASSISGTLMASLNDVFYHNNLRPELRYFNKQLFKEFSPDINGYTLVYFIPPELKMINVDTSKGSMMSNISKFMIFAAVDFSPPTLQVNSESVTGRSGGMPYATEVVPSEQLSITFMDDSKLSIYKFHQLWVQYINESLEGLIKLDSIANYLEYESGANKLYGALDYAASAFVIRYSPSMKELQFVAKCTGIFPQSLPNKELLGSRTANELTTLPFSYFCSYYEEATTNNHPIWKELEGCLSIYDDDGFKVAGDNMSNIDSSSTV